MHEFVLQLHFEARWDLHVQPAFALNISAFYPHSEFVIFKWFSEYT
jgi:hypothetical protein